MKKFLLSLFVASFLLTIISCSKSSSGGTNMMGRDQAQMEGESVSDQGHYRAVLKPLNTAVAGNVLGTVEIKIIGDDVIFRNNITGAPSGVKHFQNIMTASVCPGNVSDKNTDSFIDFKELIAVSGKILLPLDSDLTTQLSGMDFGPIANSAGSYVYTRSASLTQLMSDLQDRDPDLADPIVKLNPGENLLGLSRRVVVIHGVKASALLPATVASIDNIPAELLIPIACGDLVRVASEEPVASETVVTSSETSTKTD